MLRLTWCKELCWQEKLDSSLDSSDRIVFSSQNHPSNRQAPVYDAYFTERRCIPASVSPHFSRYRPKSKIIRARKASLASLASYSPHPSFLFTPRDHVVRPGRKARSRLGFTTAGRVAR